MSEGDYPPGGPIYVPQGPGPLYGEMAYPGHGYLPRTGEGRPALSAWARLARGGALGKKANLTFKASGQVVQNALTPILQVQGDDADAQQIVVTLSPPLVVPRPFSSLSAGGNPQNVTGEQGNANLLDQVAFPGLLNPIEWPPIEAVLEWGVGGTSNRAQVDFVNGSTACVVASWLRVFGRIVSGPATGISGTSAVYTLAAFVGPGIPGSPAQKTVYVGDVDSLTESAVFPVPPFARSAYVVSSDPAAGPGIVVGVSTLRFWQSPDGVAGGKNVGNFFVSSNQAERFPVPAGAAYASVFNQTGITSRLSIVYNLSI